MADVIRESSATRTDIPRTLESVGHYPLHEHIEALTAPLIDHVFRLAGADPDSPQHETRHEREDNRVRFSDYFERLFTIATGWLGWSPEQAWSATPAEIITAYNGRLDMLGAIFGTKTDDGADPDSEAVKSGIAKLKAIAAVGGNIGAR